MPEGFGFRAWVSTDEEALQEYKVDIDLGRREVKCWIPSQAGKRFKVVWENRAHPTRSVCGEITLDGTWARGIIRRKGNMTLAVAETVITSPTTARHFVFSPLTLTDDDSLLGSPSAQHVGTIVLKISEVELAGSIQPTQIRHIDGQTTIHERSKKGLVHSVGFGPEVDIPVQTTQPVIYGEMLATFVFQYRPLDVLQANDIAPPPFTKRENTSEPGNKRKAEEVIEISDDDDEDEDDIDRLRARRLRALEGKHAKEKRVKTESRAALIPGEVIDLT